jgi:hypothetical protein
LILEINAEEKKLLLDILDAAEGEVVPLHRWSQMRPAVEALEAKIKALHGGTEQDYEDIYR